ncbi:MAG: glycoside hydrolase family 5 protein [Opitutaceae bacterium]|jgi:hypothetical protein|nr:glycoside hydrolase family 5 protein [Opitutaceae bacterium]
MKTLRKILLATTALAASTASVANSVALSAFTPTASADREHLWLRVKGKHIVTSPLSADGEQPFIAAGIGYARDVIISAQDDAVMQFCKTHFLNTVRLSFYTNYIKKRPIDIDEHIENFIEPVIAAARRHNLYVILDAHEYMSSKVDEATAREKQRTTQWDAAHLEKWIAGWRAVARRYKDEPQILGYELLNEPHDIPVEFVRENYLRCLREIRAIDTRHIVLLGNRDWSHARAMEPTWGNSAATLDAPRNNVVFAFHDYPEDNHPHIVQDRITKFRDAHNVPVMCTEFGATHWNKSETVCRKFLAGMHTLFARENVGWMVWALTKLEDNPRAPYNEVDKTGLGPPRVFDSCAYSDLWAPAAQIHASKMPAASPSRRGGGRL